ncbi:hypothetical protein BP5796_05652 [Coleophoma crateriformis]|uniref:Amino acid transporter n=1 Tax=Coleophoma crateriformis TaxID=565419 RepID=A0A3D8S4H3_9HELO|nr:hypothetical protein BP5796_05652 [Coleophoma crateriformis]
MKESSHKDENAPDLAPPSRGQEDDVDLPNEVDDGYHAYLGSTFADRKDMNRLGRAQELKRNFRTLSTFSFIVLLQDTWEAIMIACTQGLGDGGLAGLFWTYIFTFIGLGFVYMSLAEMASMSPTAGGQYHWVSEFSGTKYQRFLSHQTGWMSTLSLQAGTASSVFLVGTLLQSFITVNYPAYAPTRWQATLIMIAVTVVIYSLNMWAAGAMPVVQNVMLVIHIAGCLAIVIVIWVLSPRNTADVVFTQFLDQGAWGSMGLTLMVGQSSAIYGLIGTDMVPHLSEEIRDASRTVPHTMISSFLLNGLLGMAVLVTFLFAITNIDDALNDETGYPFVWVLRQTVSIGGLNGLTVIVLILCFASATTFNLATSRALWAFARDQGLPFSSWIARVHPKLHVPANAILVTCGFVVVLSFIDIGSNIAFDAIVSLNVVSLMFTYMMSIGCVLVHRVRHPGSLPRSPFSLGKWGVTVNIVGLSWSTFAFFWCFWPNTSSVTTQTFNWGVLMFLITLTASLTDYMVRARKSFAGPVSKMHIS